MYSKPMVWKILSGLVVIAVLAGCGAAPTATATSTPVPTVDTKPTLDAVSTQAVQTAMANLTLTAPTATLTPTSTTVPTDTPAPSETPTLTATATKVFIPWTKTPTPTQAAYSCVVTSVSPKSSETKKVNADFDGVWQVTNTGSKTWIAGNTDIRWTDGTRFQKNGDLVDLKSDVAPNGTTTVTIDMRAPSSDGTYNTSWGIYLEDGSVCALNMTLNVSK